MKTKAKEKGLDFTKDDVNTCFNKILGYYLKDFRLYKEKERLKKDKEDLQEKKNEEIKKLLEANEEKNKEMEQFQEQKNNEIKELLKENKKNAEKFQEEMLRYRQEKNDEIRNLIEENKIKEEERQEEMLKNQEEMQKLQQQKNDEIKNIIEENRIKEEKSRKEIMKKQEEMQKLQQQKNDEIKTIIEENRIKEAKNRIELEKKQEELNRIQRQKDNEIKSLIEENRIKEEKRQMEIEADRIKREEEKKEQEAKEEKRREEERQLREAEKQERIKQQEQFQKTLLEQHDAMEQQMKQKNIEFQNILQAQKEQFTQIMENNASKAQEEYNRMIQEIKDKAEKDKKELEEKLIQEKNLKKKEINEQFEKEVEIEIMNEIKQLSFEFKKLENTFCLDNIKKFDKNLLINTLKTLIRNEQIGKKIKEKVKLNISKLIDEPSRRVNHLNILVLGKTGVGKSFLLKTILGFTDDNSDNGPKDGFFRPETKGKPVYYESNLVDFIRIADTQGIEVGKYGIYEAERDITNFISEQNENGIPDKYVHCIWYCINPNGGRFQEEEEELLVRLSNNYSIETLPIILVGTQSNSKQKVNQFIKYFSETNLKIKFDFIPVMAQQLDDIPAFGLDKLQNLSIEKSKKAIKSQCYQGILQDVKKLFENTIEEKAKEMIASIEEHKNKCLKDIEKGTNISNLKNQILDIFIIIFNSFNYFLEENELALASL